MRKENKYIKKIIITFFIFLISSINVFAETLIEYWDKKYWKWKYIIVTVEETLPWMDCKKNDNNDLYNCFAEKKEVKKYNNFKILLYFLPENVEFLLKIMAPWFYKI